MATVDGIASSDSYLEEALQDALRLMKYAAEVGVDIDPQVRHDVAQARAASGAVWSQEAGASLLTALTQLAAELKPVTAESLRACHDESQRAVTSYLRWAVCLAIVIVPFSIGSFVTSGFSEAITKDVVNANALAVKLVAQLHPSEASTTSTGDGAVALAAIPAGLSIAEVVTELQEFAALIRSIDYRARRLNAFVFFLEKDPFGEARGNASRLHKVFQLPAELPSHLEDAVDDRVVRYQDVRYFAQSLQEDVAMFYGAVATCLLPRAVRAPRHVRIPAAHLRERDGQPDVCAVERQLRPIPDRGDQRRGGRPVQQPHGRPGCVDPSAGDCVPCGLCR